MDEFGNRSVNLETGNEEKDVNKEEMEEDRIKDKNMDKEEENKEEEEEKFGHMENKEIEEKIDENNKEEECIITDKEEIEKNVKFEKEQESENKKCDKNKDNENEEEHDNNYKEADKKMNENDMMKIDDEEEREKEKEEEEDEEKINKGDSEKEEENERRNKRENDENEIQESLRIEETRKINEKERIEEEEKEEKEEKINTVPEKLSIKPDFDIELKQKENDETKMENGKKYEEKTQKEEEEEEKEEERNEGVKESKENQKISDKSKSEINEGKKEEEKERKEERNIVKLEEMRDEKKEEEGNKTKKEEVEENKDEIKIIDKTETKISDKKENDENGIKKNEDETGETEKRNKGSKEEVNKEKEQEEKPKITTRLRQKSENSQKSTKTVNFRESVLEIEENNVMSKSTLATSPSYTSFSAVSSSTSSSSSSSSKPKEETSREDKEKQETEERIGSQRVLLEGNPIYRLSLKFSNNLFPTTDIPGASQHKDVEKTGYLNKLSGRSFPYIAQWKRRYCVLSRGGLYYYEREDSKGNDKTNGVVQLEYFDQVIEANPKECKKATNVFIITSHDRSFFDPGRHLFSADTLPDMKDWIRRLQSALEQIRNNNRPTPTSALPPEPVTKEEKKKKEEEKENKGNNQEQISNKEKRKKKEESGGSRGRKLSKTGIFDQTQPSATNMTCKVDGRQSVVVPKGGVMLPGFTSRQDSQRTNRPDQTTKGTDDVPGSGPVLMCVTKERVKGPQGRRVPGKHRKSVAAALNKRAQSLTALEHQNADDTRSEGSEGVSLSFQDSRTSDLHISEFSSSSMDDILNSSRERVNQEPLREEEEKMDSTRVKESGEAGDSKRVKESGETGDSMRVKESGEPGESRKSLTNTDDEYIKEHSAEREFKIADIDDGLFFKAGLERVRSGMEADVQRRSASTKEASNGTQDNHRSSSTSKNGTLNRFREAMTSRKKKVRNEGVNQTRSSRHGYEFKMAVLNIIKKSIILERISHKQ